MKKLIYLFIWIFIISCSSDDDPYYPPPTIQVPAKITVTNGSNVATYTFNYDSQRRVSKVMLASNTNATMVFTYNAQNRITQVVTTGAEPSTAVYFYDSGKLNGYIYSGDSEQDTPITYNTIEDQYYSFDPVHVFSFYDNRDVKRGDDNILVYDGNKGAFANVNSDYQLLGIFGPPGTSNFFYMGSKKALDYAGPVADPDQFDFTNTYVDGYITKATVSTLTITYTYTKIY